MFAFDVPLQQLAKDRSSCSADALATGLKQLAGLRAAVDAREANLLRHFDRLGGGRRDGAADQVAWLRRETGISRRDAATRVQAAAVLEQTPVPS